MGVSRGTVDRHRSVVVSTSLHGAVRCCECRRERALRGSCGAAARVAWVKGDAEPRAMRWASERWASSRSAWWNVCVMWYVSEEAWGERRCKRLSALPELESCGCDVDPPRWTLPSSPAQPAVRRRAQKNWSPWTRPGRSRRSPYLRPRGISRSFMCRVVVGDSENV